MTVSEGEPVDEQIGAAVWTNVAQLRLTSEAQDLVSQRIALMGDDARRLFATLSEDEARAEFEIGVRELASGVAAEAARLVLKLGEQSPEIDQEQVRRSMGIICPTRPFCSGK